MITAREKVLVDGLDDWVKVYQVHRHVARDNPEDTLDAVQRKTLDLLTELGSEGLIEFGELRDHGATWVSWDSPVDESVDRIRGVYVERFADSAGWPWTLWINVTDAGKRAAQAALPEYQAWIADMRARDREYEPLSAHLEPG